jgi:ELWxxDGT repeat protein
MGCGVIEHTGRFASPRGCLTARMLYRGGGTLFFTADDGSHGIELWMSDGTEAGTVLVGDIYPGTTESSSNPQYLTDVNGTLFFAADDGNHGVELWAVRVYYRVYLPLVCETFSPGRKV